MEYHHYLQRHPVCPLDDRLARMSTSISEVIASQVSIDLDTLIRLRWASTAPDVKKMVSHIAEDWAQELWWRWKYGGGLVRTGGG
jgi:hypothetical protein